MKMESKLDRQKVTLVVVTVLLILALGYILVNEYNAMKAAEENQKLEEQNSVFQQGFSNGTTYGYQLAVIQLLQQASTCQSVPVTANNVTLNLVAVECLQQAE